MARTGRPRHIASASVIEDTQELLIIDRFLSIPAFAEHNCTEYTREQIISAVMGYVLTGSSRKASQVSGVKDNTIRRWKCDSKWWDDCVIAAREVLSEKLEDKFTALMNETLSQLATRLEDGDIIVREGKTTNIPVKASELARILNVLFEKRQLLRGDVTSRSETKTASGRLDELREAAERVIRDSAVK